MLTGPELSGPLPNERLAIAFSGGGDSTALLHLCRHLKPSPLVLIVDHALRRGSAAEAKTAQTFAESLGMDARILVWEHDGIGSAVQEKARRARYGLMGGICRAENIRYLLTGHTQNDQAETLLMRYGRGTDWRGAAGIRRDVHAPVWPELARITVLRPLLHESRDRLRAYNKAQNIVWSEDPGNSNLKFDRVKARQYLSTRPALANQLIRTAKDMQKGRDIERDRLAAVFSDQVTVLPNSDALQVSGKLPSQLWKLLLQAAAGNDSPISDQSVKTLIAASRRDDFSGQTLGGAFVKKSADTLIIGPDPSVFKSRQNRKSVKPMPLIPGQKHIWDGRFEIETSETGLIAVTVYDARKRLNSENSANLTGSLKTTEFSDSMPVVMKNAEVPNVFVPPPGNETVSIKSLIRPRINSVLKIN